MSGSIRCRYWLKWGLGSIGVNFLLSLTFYSANRLFPAAPTGDLAEPRFRFMVLPLYPLLQFADYLADPYHGLLHKGQFFYTLLGRHLVLLIPPYWFLLGVVSGLFVRGLFLLIRETGNKQPFVH